ncbi:hypothetical protein GCM10010383_35880 [Streptomyces lomondensis]|uniref:Uncharacterized protein n=2 Tax=Streptomyces lomondensis TaxID=68229 RepID=A0ABQ2X6V7_9ACTN|nr:hypothetical protein GCM10010383_35880 [Streptomyces lomondensis]
MLNELAQGLRPLSQGLAWFEDMAEEEQFVVLRELFQFCVQARAVGEDALEGIRRSGLRPTHTPAVLLARGRIEEQLGKVARLRPRHERIKAFRLLVQVLGLADARRRERFCVDGCGHAWHRLAGEREAGLPVG